MARIEVVGQACWLEWQQFAAVAHPWGTGRIGLWTRAPANGWTYEAFVRFDIARVRGTISSVQIEMVCDRAGQELSQVPAKVWNQDRVSHTIWDDARRPPKFDDLPLTRWNANDNTPLDAVPAPAVGTNVFADTAGRIKALVESWVAGQKDWRDGVVITLNPQNMNSWLNVSSLKLIITTTESGGGPGGPFTVEGQVKRTDGTAVTPALVVAYDRGFGREKELGRCQVVQGSTDGAYSIVYEATDLIDAQKASADLIVRAYADDSLQQVLASSRLIDGAKIREWVMLYVAVESTAARTPEYDEIAAAVSPFIPASGLAGLGDDDAAVLGRQLGLDSARVLAYVRARQIAQDSGADAEFLYGLFRHRAQKDTRQLASADEGTLKAMIASAVSLRLVSEEWSSERMVAAQLSLLRSNAVSRVVGVDAEDTTLLRDLMTRAGFGTTAKHEDLVRIYMDRDYTDENGFWTNIAASVEFGEVGAEALKRFFDLADIAEHHPDMASQFSADPRIVKPRDVTRLSDGDLSTFINTAGVPYDIVGATDSEKKSNYLNRLKDTFESRFPSMTLSTKLPGLGDPNDQFLDFRTFINDHDDFDIAQHNIDAYASAHGLTIDKKLRAQILQLQSLHKVIPTARPGRTAACFVEHEMATTVDIARMGFTRFREKVLEITSSDPSLDRELNLDEAAVKGIFKSAVASISKTLAAMAANSFGDTRPIVFGTEPVPPGGEPTLASLFGSQDSCAVEHWASVFGPGAYLVDCLEYLKRVSGNVAGKNAYDALVARRPDIPGIQLTKANTDTLMPYVDLVNELLEHAICELPPPSYSGGTNHTLQTTLTAEELAAYPDSKNTLPEAYDKLAQRVYPWNFDLNRVEAAAYLAKAGVPRYRLIERCNPGAQQLDLACEVLGITRNENLTAVPPVFGELSVLAPSTIPEPPPALPGIEDMFGEGATLVPPDPDDPMNVVNDLHRLSALVRRTRLTYEELVPILKAKFVNPTQQAIDFHEDEGVVTYSSCALEKATIALREEDFENLYRFRILLKKTEWSVEALDALLYVDGAPPPTQLIDMPRICQLAAIKRLELERSIGVEYIVAAFGDADAGVKLVKKAVNLSTSDVEGWAETLEYDLGDPLAVSSGMDLERFASLVLAFREVGWDYEQVAYLRGEFDGYDKQPTDEEIVEFFKGLQARVAEAQGTVYMREMLLALFARRESAKAELAAAQIALAEEQAKPDPDPAVIAALTQQIADLQVEIPALTERMNLLLKDAGNFTSTAEIEQALPEETILAQLFTSAFSDKEVLDKTTEDPDKEALVPDAVAIVEKVEELDGEDHAFIDAYFGAFTNPTEAWDAMSGAVSPAERFAYVRKAMFENAVVQQFAAKFAIGGDLARDLLAKRLKVDVSVPPGVNLSALEYFTRKEDEADPGSLPGSLFLAQENDAVFGNVHRLSDQFFAFAIVAEAAEMELAFLEYAATRGFLLVPDSEDPVELDPLTIPNMEWILRIAAMRDAFAENAPDVDFFTALTGDPTDPGVQIQLANGLATSQSEVDALVVHYNITTGMPGHEWMYLLSRVFEELATLEVGTEIITAKADWVSLWISSYAAHDIRAAVAELFADDWSEVGPEIKDPIRSRQRDVLEATLLVPGTGIVNPFSPTGTEIVDRNTLYSYFLVDPGMEPINKISRMVLATSSVQLFMQRALLGFEKGVAIDETTAKEWTWRRYYRVWEANRKVFLYPENWIEPELRDDKTPLFKELEDELLQGDVNAETAEAAYLSYLHKLREISNLDIVGLYKEYYYEEPVKLRAPTRMAMTMGSEVEPISPKLTTKHFDYKRTDDYTLHVFGRTRSAPGKVYYRKQVDGIWTAWEKVELDIESKQVMPVFYNRRLFLFWPVFTTKSHKIDDSHDLSYFEIQLKYSSYDNGRWTPPTLSSEVISTLDFNHHIESGIFEDGYEKLYQELDELFDVFSLAVLNGCGIELVRLSKEENTDPLAGNVIEAKSEVSEYFSAAVRKTTDKDKILQVVDASAASLIGAACSYLMFVYDVDREEALDTITTAKSDFHDDADSFAEQIHNLAHDVALFRDEMDDLSKFVFKTFFDETTQTMHVFAGLASLVLIKNPFGRSSGYPELTELASNFAEYDDYIGTVWLLGGFAVNGCTGGVELTSIGGQHLYAPLLYSRPTNTAVDGMKLKRLQVNSHDGLRLVSKKGNANYLNPADYLQSMFLTENLREEAVLGAAPRQYELIAPQQDFFFLAESPFVFQDSKKAFLVVPEERYLSTVRVSDNLQFSHRTRRMHSRTTSRGLTSGAVANALMTRGLHIPTSVKKAQALTTKTAIAIPTSNYGLASTDLQTGLKTTLDRLSKSISGILVGVPFQTMATTYPGVVFKPLIWAGKRYEFHNFCHPYTCLFVQQLNRYGVDGLLRPGHGDGSDVYDRYLIRQGADDTVFFGGSAIEEYKPSATIVSDARARAEIDFDITGTYSVYNWELFFHAPMLIATRLMQNGQYEEAMRWFEYVFDPKADDKKAPQVYWRTKPFYETAKKLGDSIINFVDDADDIEKLLHEWYQNPFNPHLIARFRKLAYMKNAVMRYLDNLIAWGDMLFTRDTLESINEATQLYVTAAQILGRQPINAVKDAPAEGECYAEISEALVGRIPFDSLVVDLKGDLDDEITVLHSLLYFGGVPRNENLLAYWTTVGDRLFKIHNSMNIDGVVRALALFAPPIDPALLVRAAAAGLDIGNVLNDLAAPMPIYRFRVLLQKAIELVSDVKGLGAALLSALEKKDAEALAALRSTHEVSTLEAMLSLKKQAIEEAKANLEAIEATKATTEARLAHYESLIDAGLLPEEMQNQKKLGKADDNATIAGIFETIAGALALVPDFSTGFYPPSIGMSFGGSNISRALSAFSSGYRLESAHYSYEANKASIDASNKRRLQEWKLQEKLATKELAQIEKQIIAAEIRVAIAETDLTNTQKQIDNAREAYAFLKDKYTNVQLYGWMIGQISGVYYQAYKLAYDMARKAEKAYKAELIDDAASYVKFDNWDSLHKGLLAGEKLHNDLKRLDAAYLERNKRRQEITKNVSLALVAPESLVALRDEGVCEFAIPEVAYDLDYPGQYQRRIKSISLTIPCVAGPNTSVGAKLSLTGDRIRKNAVAGPDAEFIDSFGGVQSVATSQGVNDAGMFELNFNDDRYLPFEGAGVISNWRLELPKTVRPFDYTTINDVVVTVRYTARDDGKLRQDVEDGIVDAVATAGLGLVVSLEASFPAELELLKAGGSTPIPLDLAALVPEFLKNAGATTASEGVRFYTVSEDGTVSGGSTPSVTPTDLTVSLVSSELPAEYDDVLLSVKLTIG